MTFKEHCAIAAMRELIRARDGQVNTVVIARDAWAFAEAMEQNHPHIVDKIEIPPDQGGCWFCSKDDGAMAFSVEFDTFVHLSCIERALNSDPSHPEAVTMRKELLASRDIEPGDITP